jgi:triosephosphate isomerase
MRKPFLAGNWKMHGSLAQNAELLAALRAGLDEEGVEVVVCPPFPYLAQATDVLAGCDISIAAQDVSERGQGAYTGDVSAAMLSDLGCRYVLVGHSERRTLHGETDAVVAAKFSAAQAVGLLPILCVGETLEEREAGRAQEVVRHQLSAVIKVCGANALTKMVLAYEPVWAIGTGRSATAGQAAEVHSWLRAAIAEESAEVAAGVRIVYGGSVKAANAAELFAMQDIDGALVGGASLVASEFLSIAHFLGSRG